MRCCVIIPTYENLSTLPTILDDCDAANLPVIVVDDGSTDGTAEAIRTWLDQGENRELDQKGRGSVDNVPSTD